MSASRSTVALLSALVLLSGCSALQDFLARDRGAEEPALPPLAERPRLEPISRNYFELESRGQTVVGEPQIVFVGPDDTFSDLAREYGLGYDELVDANPGIDPWLPGEGTPVLLPTQYVLPDVPWNGIVLNVAAKRLFYFPEVPAGAPAGAPIVVITYPMGIGRVGWDTPVGEARVVAKATDPVWYVPWSVQQEHRQDGDPLPAIVPPGPDNPLGRHVLQLNLPGYLIHGTNQPYGVGMRVSHGCVRLYPENIEQLYSMVGVGVPVRIINEPFLLGRKNGELYLEAHPPLEDDPVSAEMHLERIFDAGRRTSSVFVDVEEQNRARTVASDRLGIPVRVLLGDAFEVFSRARIVKNTVVADPDAPTLAEVRELLDAPPEPVEAGVSSVTEGPALPIPAGGPSGQPPLDE